MPETVQRVVNTMKLKLGGSPQKSNSRHKEKATLTWIPVSGAIGLQITGSPLFSRDIGLSYSQVRRVAFEKEIPEDVA